VRRFRDISQLRTANSAIQRRYDIYSTLIADLSISYSFAPWRSDHERWASLFSMHASSTKKLTAGERSRVTIARLFGELYAFTDPYTFVALCLYCVLQRRYSSSIQHSQLGLHLELSVNLPREYGFFDWFWKVLMSQMKKYSKTVGWTQCTS
jgi:hypothetical protein